MFAREVWVTLGILVYSFPHLFLPLYINVAPSLYTLPVKFLCICRVGESARWVKKQAQNMEINYTPRFSRFRNQTFTKHLRNITYVRRNIFLAQVVW